MSKLRGLNQKQIKKEMLEEIKSLNRQLIKKEEQIEAKGKRIIQLDRLSYIIQEASNNQGKQINEVHDLVKDIFFYIDEYADFSNGNTDNGYDEGRVNAIRFFKKKRQHISKIIGGKE